MKRVTKALGATWLAGIAGLTWAASPEPQAQDQDRAFERLVARLDKNLDGKISQAEFNRGRRAFQRFDTDKDGFLSKEEFKARRNRGRQAQPAPQEPSMGESMGPVDMPTGTAEQLEFFEKKIRPVLSDHCYQCHSEGAQRLRGGLKLDSRDGFLKGGDYGPAMVVGDVDASAFIQAIRYEEPEFGMPPREKLSDEEIRDLETWVKMGAPWAPEPDRGTFAMTPRAGDDPDAHESLNREIDIEAGREFWAFQKPVRTAPPSTNRADWARGDVDRFLLAQMESMGVEPVGDADDRTWLRRATFDLTGLPPTPEEIEAYLADKSDERDATVVDRLLASEAYAERWGRHWLDVARYAESSGKERNILYPHAWRYRDWVLQAFRDDMPYNRFLKLQLAGDIVPVSDETERAWNQIATGYLAIGPKGHATRDRRQFQIDMVDEQIDAFSQGMLGLTVSCARCHDHKFDPIPTEDYYALAGIFWSTETHFGTMRSVGNNQASTLIDLPQGADLPNGPTMDATLRRFLDRGQQRLRDQGLRDQGNRARPGQGGASMDEEMGSREMSEADRRDEERRAAQQARRRAQQQGVFEDLRSRFDDRGRPLPSNRLAMGVSEGEGHDIAVLERGELDRPGEVVPRNMPQVLRSPDLPPIREGSGRLELARWVSSPDNPLTARVWANRVWLHLFGTGFVSTPDNFGMAGQRPSHPELLDWLAVELMENGWSTKGLIRTIALSRAYRLSSRIDPKAAAIDPEVTSLWRMPKRRLESEALRDAMLAVSGTLQRKAPVGSVAGTLEGGLRNEQVANLMLREQPIRSVYLPSPRGFTMETLAAFDAPDSEFVTGDRDETTVATQALFLMNDPEVLRMADAFADRLLRIEGKDSDRIRMAFELAYGRKPTSSESKAVTSFLRDYAKEVQKTLGSNRASDRQAGSNGRNRQRERARQRARDRARQRGGQAGATAPEAFTDPQKAAWSALAQSLFQGAEFRTLN